MDLRVNKVAPELIRQLKRIALDSGKTLREYVIELLEKAAKGN